jgi:hypothetical protein
VLIRVLFLNALNEIREFVSIDGFERDLIRIAPDGVFALSSWAISKTSSFLPSVSKRWRMHSSNIAMVVSRCCPSTGSS